MEHEIFPTVTFLFSTNEIRIKHLQNAFNKYANMRMNADRNLATMIKPLLNNDDIDPNIWHGATIHWAAHNGHLEIVRMLLADPRVNPVAWNNTPIHWAARNGHLEIVKLLLMDSRVDPHANGGLALYWAEKNNDCEMIKLLKSVS